ncbi:MAG: hypothetical protein RJQ07_12420 [Pseudomonadales bacterium]
MYYLRMPALLMAVFVTTLMSVEGFAAETRLESEMTAEEFKASGLHKLTDAELRALALWIDRQQALPQPDKTLAQPAAPVQAPARPQPAPQPKPKVVDPVASFGQEQIEQQPDASLPESISSRIVGEFRGWNGSTVFRLQNGQVWRQRVGGKYRSALRTDPEVVVEKGRFGYYLKLVESGRSVGVKRIH